MAPSRLHDLRSSKSYEKVFVDTVNTSPIYGIQPFGHDRFVVGAGADAVVKIFDLRMSNTYDYIKSITSSDSGLGPPARELETARESKRQANFPQKDFSIFVSHRPPANAIPDSRRHPRLRRYRGSIYSMSSPSPSSPTIYTGLSDGISRIDFVSTRDLMGPQGDWHRENLALDLNLDKSPPLGEMILGLSGYERPSLEYSSAAAQLRIQKPFFELTDQDVANERETGWDRRWVRFRDYQGWGRRR
jgi:WD40 repeat protein